MTEQATRSLSRKHLLGLSVLGTAAIGLFVNKTSRAQTPPSAGGKATSEDATKPRINDIKFTSSTVTGSLTYEPPDNTCNLPEGATPYLGKQSIIQGVVSDSGDIYFGYESPPISAGRFNVFPSPSDPNIILTQSALGADDCGRYSRTRYIIGITRDRGQSLKTAEFLYYSMWLGTLSSDNNLLTAEIQPNYYIHAPYSRPISILDTSTLKEKGTNAFGYLDTPLEKVSENQYRGYGSQYVDYRTGPTIRRFTLDLTTFQIDDQQIKLPVSAGRVLNQYVNTQGQPRLLLTFGYPQRILSVNPDNPLQDYEYLIHNDNLYPAPIDKSPRFSVQAWRAAIDPATNMFYALTAMERQNSSLVYNIEYFQSDNLSESNTHQIVTLPPEASKGEIDLAIVHSPNKRFLTLTTVIYENNETGKPIIESWLLDVTNPAAIAGFRKARIFLNSLPPAVSRPQLRQRLFAPFYPHGQP